MSRGWTIWENLLVFQLFCGGFSRNLILLKMVRARREDNEHFTANFTPFPTCIPLRILQQIFLLNLSCLNFHNTQPKTTKQSHPQTTEAPTPRLTFSYFHVSHCVIFASLKVYLKIKLVILCSLYCCRSNIIPIITSHHTLWHTVQYSSNISLHLFTNKM